MTVGEPSFVFEWADSNNRSTELHGSWMLSPDRISSSGLKELKKREQNEGQKSRKGQTVVECCFLSTARLLHPQPQSSCTVTGPGQDWSCQHPVKNTEDAQEVLNTPTAYT